MTALNLEAFCAAARDAEATRYRIMHEFKRIDEQFARSRLYPHLALLINLYSNLNAIVSSESAVRDMMSKTVKGVDLETRRLLYEYDEPENSHIANVTGLIHWAMPILKQKIDEGRTIYEFVERNLTLSVVGLLPRYQAEGYVFVPDAREQRCHLLRYELSLYTSSDERYRQLKTVFVRTVQTTAVQRSPGTLKMELVRQFPDLPNPATYSFATELDFPFVETIYPVAKRKLLHNLAA